MIESNKHHEAAKYISLTEHQRNLSALHINEKKLASMPADLQKVVLDAAHEASAHERKKDAEFVAAAADRLTSKGAVLTAPDKARFIALIAPIQDEVAKDLKATDLLQIVRPPSRGRGRYPSRASGCDRGDDSIVWSAHAATRHGRDARLRRGGRADDEGPETPPHHDDPPTHRDAAVRARALDRAPSPEAPGTEMVVNPRIRSHDHLEGAGIAAGRARHVLDRVEDRGDRSQRDPDGGPSVRRPRDPPHGRRHEGPL
ncbi:MAG: hypothetical protein ACREMB_08125 [Candidatus Rokuibacteriota bacterium]